MSGAKAPLRWTNGSSEATEAMDSKAKAQIYEQIGQEVESGQLSRGLMARATGESGGDPNRAKSLYIKYRFKEIASAHEREQAQRLREEETQRLRQEAEKKRREEAERADREREDASGIYRCPQCQRQGQITVQARGNDSVGCLLFLLGIVPGVIYALTHVGFKGVCPNCGAVIRERLSHSALKRVDLRP